MTKKYVEKFNILGEEIFIKGVGSEKPKQLDIYSIGKVLGNGEHQITFDWTFCKEPNDGKVLMCDTGFENTTLNVSTILGNIGVTKIDGIYISHYDSDHVGNLEYLLTLLDHTNCVAYIPVAPQSKAGEEVIGNYNKVVNLLNDKHISIVYPTESNVYTLGEMKLKFYNTVHTQYYVQETFNYNNCSLCMQLEYDDTTVWFSGDLYDQAQKLIGASVPHSTVCKIAHHGYNRFCDEVYFRNMSPDYYFCTNGTGLGNDEAVRPLDKYSVENALAQHHNIPVYTTSNSPNYVLHFSIGFGSVEWYDTPMLDNEITQSGTVGSLNEILEQTTATATYGLKLGNFIKKLKNKQSLHTILPTAFTAYPFDKTAVLDMNKNDSSFFSGTFEDKKVTGRFTECVNGNARPQITDFMYSENANGTFDGWIKNSSVGNFYRLGGTFGSGNTISCTMKDYFGSDIDKNDLVAKRPCICFVSCNVSFHTHTSANSKVTIKTGTEAMFPPTSMNGTYSWSGIIKLDGGESFKNVPISGLTNGDKLDMIIMPLAYSYDKSDEDFIARV